MNAIIEPLVKVGLDHDTFIETGYWFLEDAVEQNEYYMPESDLKFILDSLDNFLKAQDIIRTLFRTQDGAGKPRDWEAETKRHKEILDEIRNHCRKSENKTTV